MESSNCDLYDLEKEKGSPLNGKSREDTEKDKDFISNDVFQHFHVKYLQLMSEPLSGDKENCCTNEETKLLLESMVEDLNVKINKIDDNNVYFLRLLSMKIFLQHIVAKFLDDNESSNLLEKVYENSKLYIMKPEVTYSCFLAINGYATVKQKLHYPLGLIKIKEILEECQTIYKTLKHTNKEDIYYSGKELFSPEKEMPINKEATIKYEKLVITNLLLLGSIYEKLDDHYKDIVCYHTAFKRMLNKGLVNPYKWVDFTTRLACVFIDDNNFKDARHHLAAATHVHEILEVKYSSTTDAVKKELIKNNAIHLALAWVRYCILLFEKSKDEDRKKFAILFKNGYLNPQQRPAGKPTVTFSEDEFQVLNEKKIFFENPTFLESIEKEIDDDYDDFTGIIKENCKAFGDFLDEVTHTFRKGSNTNTGLKDELQFNMKNCDDAQKSCSDDRNDNSKAETRLTMLHKHPEELCKTDLNHTGDKEVNFNEHIKGMNEGKIKSINSKENLVNQKRESEKMKTTENDEKKKEPKKHNEHHEKDMKENDLPEEKHKEDIEFNDKVVKIDIKTDKSINEKNLTFSSLGYLPVEHSVTKDIIRSPEDAKNLFMFGQSWSKRAQAHYPKDTDFFCYINVVLNMVSLYRLCAYFQGRDNLEYRINLEQIRENLLEHLVTEMNEIQPENHLHVRLYQEMALLNVDLAMLNMCNIYNISADDSYKICALREIQSHINHVYIVGDMLEKSTKVFDETKTSGESGEITPVKSTSNTNSTSTITD